MSYVNNMSNINRLKCLFLFLNCLKFLFWFCNIYKDGKPNYKNENIDRKIFLKTLNNQKLVI